MLGATRIVDPVARAQIIETVGPGRMLAPRQQQRIDQALACRPHVFPARSSSALRKPRSKHGIMGDERCVAEKGKQLVDDLGERAACP